ncbi:MAG TPA: AmmeMemoRadiSam system radical SAM enzyme [Desulfosalsimonadaceae bacterium]|nr:AmmeMemoRadiSam system radical SAM enzyme [Desulfosalsimonadaceae bacterium]
MEARLYEKREDNKVQCHLCRHHCVIRDGRRGICNVRENRDGVLYTLVYDRIIARHVDPIEKKPLFHFFPGTLAYSIGTVGCNFRCRFCQNADIAHMAADDRGHIMGSHATPEGMVAEALKSGCKSIAYTYTEPTVFFELALETARLAHQRGLKNVFVTNGYMSEQALEGICPYLDAANVDLKAFSEDFYKSMCSARLSPVMEILRQMKTLDIFVEVTTLLIPGLNDDSAELEKLAGFIAHDLGSDTPWHVSRFQPCYQLTDRPPTPVQTLLQARQIGIDAGLKYVYTGNVPGEKSECTYCYNCGSRLMNRRGFFVSENRIQRNQCPDCGAVIHGVGLCG